MKSPKLEWLPGITTCLVIDVFSDEVVKMKFLLLFLDIYSMCLVAIDNYPEIVKKILLSITGSPDR